MRISDWSSDVCSSDLLSRGRHSNDLYLTSQDHRVDERHAHETQTDPLDGLRAAIGRRGAKRLALDHLNPRPPSTLPDLQDQRDPPLEQIGPEQPARTLAVRRPIHPPGSAPQAPQSPQQRLPTPTPNPPPPTP